MSYRVTYQLLRGATESAVSVVEHLPLKGDYVRWARTDPAVPGGVYRVEQVCWVLDEFSERTLIILIRA